MKILFLTSRLPYPPYRGDKLKIYNLMKQLSVRHEISLLSFVASKKEMAYVDALREYCANVEVVYLPQWRSLLNCLLNLFRTTPFQIAYFHSSEYARALSAILEGQSFNVLHVHLIRMAQYAADLKNRPPAVLDLTDAGSLYLQRFLHQTRSLVKSLFLREEIKRLRPYESILERFDLSLVCSPVDRDVLAQQAPTANIQLLFNGVDLEYFVRPGEVTPEPYSMIYTGNMSYFPNVDGIQYFVRDILPSIQRRCPRSKVFVVGQDPPRAVRNLASSSVIVTGFAPDIKEFYLRNSIAIAPIRFGAGTLNKILEPMALGMPVVATSIGVEGLPARDGEHLLIADNADDFARSVCRLFEDPSLRMMLANNAQTLVRSLYDWRKIGASLEQMYTNVADVPTYR